jgi:hypothetical protein
MVRLLPVFSICLFFVAGLSAQTFSIAPFAPLRDDAPLVSALDVSDLPGSIDTSEFGLEAVCIDLDYDEIHHLIITLYAPDGTMVKLTHLNGRDRADELPNTCFGAKGRYFPFEHPPFKDDEYQPVLPLGVVNNGQNPNGLWRLVMEESDGEDYEGVLTGWSLVFGTRPARPRTSLHSTHLPILKISTGGQTIFDDPKIDAHLSVVDHGPGDLNRPGGPFNGYDGPIGIERHGASSLTFWQPSFSFETRDAQGDDRDVALLGMPPGSDWVLHGPFSDKSLLRNALTYTLASEAGPAYVPRARFCELILDGAYLGVYTLIEKIKRGPQRVDIARMRKTDLSGDALTGGYIIKVDRRNAVGWYSSFVPDGGGKVFFNYVYPKADDIQPAQKAYIQGYVDSFENALARPGFDDPQGGWRRFAEENSFVEHFLFNELSKNVDAYRLSAFLCKARDSEGGKLRAGPLWDFNLAWHNANYANNEVPGGWTFDGEDYGVPFWWRRLLDDTAFTQNLQCRWYELRQTVLSQRHIFSVIDSLDAALGTAKDRHYSLFPIMGKGLWPNPSPVAKTYAQEIENTKSWISERLQWIDTYLPGLCPARPEAWQPAPWLVFPNPASEQITVFFESDPGPGASLELSDLAGRVVERQSDVGFESVFVVRNLPAGMYVLTCRNGDGHVLNRVKWVKT